MGDTEAALAALSLPESPNYAQIARESGVDCTALTRHFKGKQVSRQDARFQSPSLLTKQQEKDLVAMEPASFSSATGQSAMVALSAGWAVG